MMDPSPEEEILMDVDDRGDTVHLLRTVEVCSVLPAFPVRFFVVLPEATKMFKRHPKS